jgi:hypothetical protein
MKTVYKALTTEKKTLDRKKVEGFWARGQKLLNSHRTRLPARDKLVSRSVCIVHALSTKVPRAKLKKKDRCQITRK